MAGYDCGCCRIVAAAQKEITMAARNIAIASGVSDKYLGTESTDKVDGVEENGLVVELQRYAATPSETPTLHFMWKPIYWAYMGIGAVVLYTLLKK